MKKVLFLFSMFLLLHTLSAAEHDGSVPSGAGIQFSSDGMVSLILHVPPLEAGLKAGASLYDFSAEDSSSPSLLVIGAHGLWLFRPFGLEIGIGAEIRTGIGLDDVEYDEYIDGGPRISINQPITENIYISGILFPFWLETRDVSDVEEDWFLKAAVPMGGVAFTVIF